MSQPRTRVKRAKPTSKPKRSGEYRLNFCWLARETRKGWKLAVCIDVNGKAQKDTYLKGVLIENPNAISKALRKSPYRILFVHMKNSKWEPPKTATGKMTRK